ncbi:MAG: hypothetical protein ACI9KN_000290 [Gammaproteobacteria bacterium]
MKIRAIVCFIGASLLASSSFAQIAFLESNQIIEGDVAVLMVEYQDETQSMYALDTSPLDQNFEVLGVKPSVERRYENNQMVNVMHWEVTLYPYRTGLITIPSLTIKQSSTPELTLEVIGRSFSKYTDEQVWVEASANPQNPWVGQQTMITMKLVSNRRLLSGFLSNPIQN